MYNSLLFLILLWVFNGIKYVFIINLMIKPGEASNKNSKTTSRFRLIKSHRTHLTHVVEKEKNSNGFF